MTVQTSEFDEFSGSYEDSLQQGLQLSGESSDFFAQQRVAWIERVLHRLEFFPRQILDFGCGTGGSVAHLLDSFPGSSVVGVDPSEQSLQVARSKCDANAASFVAPAEARPNSCDLAFCNGVFHHIQPDDRAAALKIIHNALTNDGYFAFWENNPWNPGTRMVMARIPFDRDAITINPIAASTLLKSAGFEIVRRDFRFWFPGFLSFLRPLESLLVKVPLGAQYLVLCRKKTLVTEGNGG